MALKIMADNNEVITVSRDAALYNVFGGNQNFVIEGIGTQLTITYSSSSFVVALDTGECVICGRHIYNDDPIDLTLSANDSGYLVLRYNLDETGSNLCKFMAVNSIYSENINGSGVINDIVLAQYTTNADGVSSFIDKRVIVSSVSQDLPSGSITGTAGANKTFTSFSQTDGKVTGTIENISITKSQISDFAHTHGNITNDGKLNADVAKASGDKFVLTDASDSNKIVRSNIALGTSTSTYLRNDGAWGTPANTTYSAGDGLSLSGTTFTSVDHINQASKLVNANWGNPTTYSWTATANGWLVIKAENNTVDYYIDNVKIGGIGNYEFSQPIPVKKGQVIKAINGDSRVTNNNFTVYACK